MVQYCMYCNVKTSYHNFADSLSTDQFDPANTFVLQNTSHYLLVPTCKNQKPPSCGPSPPGKCQYWTRREHPPSASPARPAVPAAFGRWTRSLSAPGRLSPTGPSSPPLSGLRLGRCLTPGHSQEREINQETAISHILIGLWEKKV